MDYRDRIIEMRRSGHKVAAIAAELGLSACTVSRHIPRDLKRSGNYTVNPRTDLTAEERQIIEGDILGDGRLTPPESSFVHAGKEREFTAHLRRLLSRLCEAGATDRYRVTSTRLTVDHAGASRTRPIYKFSTKANPALSDLWRKWYVKAPAYLSRPGKPKLWQKSIPEDFALTPINLKYWYLGDGSLNQDTGKGVSQLIRLSSNDLPRPRLEGVVVPQLRQKVGVEIVYVREDRRKGRGDYGFTLEIPALYVAQFLNYVGACPVRCYDYKWAAHPYERKRWQRWEDNVLVRHWGRVPRQLIIKTFGSGRYVNHHIQALERDRRIRLPRYPHHSTYEAGVIRDFLKDVELERRSRHIVPSDW